VLLKKLSATNSKGQVLELPLEDIAGGFFVKEIEGLGPVKATLVSSSFANVDGEQFHSSRRDARNIIVKLGLDPDYGSGSVYHLRSQLYEYFMPKTEVKLTFEMFDKFSESVLDQFKVVDIIARVETFEPDIFAKEPGVVISMMCYAPDFYEPEPVIFSGMTVTDQTESDLEYDGTIETGVVFRLLVNRSMSGITIVHTLPGGHQHTVVVTHSLVSGDVLHVSSVVGDKYVRRTRSGTTISILYSLSPTSGWVELEPGVNKIRATASGAPVPYEVEYTTKFGGL